MVRFVATLLTTLVGLAAVAAGHPGHDVKAEAAERAAFLQHAPAHSRSLSHCSAKLKARGNEGQNVARREATVQQLRRRRSLKSGIANLLQSRPYYALLTRPDARYLKSRDLDSALNTTHHSDLDVNPSTNPSVLFGSEATCILGPDVTQGPYCLLYPFLGSVPADHCRCLWRNDPQEPGRIPGRSSSLHGHPVDQH